MNKADWALDFLPAALEQRVLASDHFLVELDHVRGSHVPMSSNATREVAFLSRKSLSMVNFLSRLLTVKNASMIPATKDAQFSELLSFGREMNVLTIGSFSIRKSGSGGCREALPEKRTFAGIVVAALELVGFFVEERFPHGSLDEHQHAQQLRVAFVALLS